MLATEIEFVAFPKIFRLARPVIVTEKIDGTNAAVGISEDNVPHGYGAGEVVGPGVVVNRRESTDEWDPVFVYAQSRKRVISPESDNFGFARWVREHANELASGLGPGLHFGEWWGKGIQRGYGIEKKRFSLFNTERWTDDVRPACCSAVPVLETLPTLDSRRIEFALLELELHGSSAAPGFKDAEGIVVYHKQGNTSFKMTIKDDDQGKSFGA